MPGLYKNIIVKVISIPYIKGDDVFFKVIMFGDPKKYEFEMKVTKTMWFSIYKRLKELEDDPLNGFMGENLFKIDEQLSYLKDRVLKIRGVPDTSRSFESKDGKGKIEYAKIFSVDFESDLEDAEKVGGNVFKNAVFEHVIYNVSCEECRILNTRAAKEAAEKKEEKEKREKEKEDKKKEVKKVEVEQAWVKRKRIEKEKENKRQKKLEYCGW